MGNKVRRRMDEDFIEEQEEEVAPKVEAIDEESDDVQIWLLVEYSEGPESAVIAQDENDDNILFSSKKLAERYADANLMESVAVRIP
jgi:hypothetical protein